MPSGLNATLNTASVWPVSGCADGLAGGRVPQPHRLVVAAGDDAVAVGAERHAVHRAGVAGQRLRRSGWPVSASHSRTVLSSLPETMRLPSGLNATLVTASVWPVSGWPIGLAGGGVPHPHRLVVAAGDDALAVGAERHAGHRAGVAGQRLRRWVGRWPRPTAAPCCRQLPETMRVPSGLNATLVTASGVAGQRLRRWVGRWRRPTAAPCCRRCRRRCACRRG